MISFRSDLEPFETQSPRLKYDIGRNNIYENDDDKDQTLQRIKDKYLGKNSPEQKKDDNLRKSSEYIYTESMYQGDHLRKSQELINSSLDDLLSNLKNKFHGLNGD